MALKRKGMVKQVLGATDLTLEAKSGESFLVRDIYLYDPTDDWVYVNIDRFTSGYFRCGGTLGNHLAFPRGASKHAHNWTTSGSALGDETDFAGLEQAGGTEIAAQMVGNLDINTTYYKVGSEEESFPGTNQTILGLLDKLGIFKGYPIPTGSKLTLDGAAKSTGIQLVVYDEYDEGDIRADQDNGPESKEFFYISYGDSGGSITTTATTVYDTLRNPSDFPGFPWGKAVPANTTIRLHGIAGSTLSMAENDGTDSIIERYLKLTKERTVLFDPDRNGLLFYDPTTTTPGDVDQIGEGFSLIGGYTDMDYRPPLIFDPPIDFEEGELLEVALSTVITNSGQTFIQADQTVGLILSVTTR